MWKVDKLTNGDFTVEYPDNTTPVDTYRSPFDTPKWITDDPFDDDGAAVVDALFTDVESLNKAYKPEIFTPAPTTTKVRPMAQDYEDDIVSILNFITKRMQLSNKQVVELIGILNESVHTSESF